MNLLRIPAKVEGDAKDALRKLEKKGITPPRILAAASLAAGVGLLIAGRKKAGIAAAVGGAAMALADEPEILREWWSNVPNYIQGAQQLLDRAEVFLDDLNTQSDRMKKVIHRG